MNSSLEWYAWDLMTFWLATGVGIVVSSGIFLLGRAGLRRLSERRTSPRRWGNPQEVRISGPFPEAMQGTVLNRSDGGLALLITRPATPNTFLSVRSCEAPEHIPWVRVCVRHCRPEGKKWLVGCQFDEEVPWSVRVWFG